MNSGVPRDRTSIAILLPAAAVYLFAAWSLVALSWDGSGYLFNSLQAGAPVITHYRYSNFPMLFALVQARAFIDNPMWLGIGYGLLLSLTPLLSLVACLRILRGPELAPLRIWPVLGILLGALPGEICLMSEASLAVQAFWPLAAFALAGTPRRGIAWMALFIPYLFFLHPTTAVMFGLAAALCLELAISRSNVRRAAIMWAGIFGIAAAGRLIHSFFYATNYERTELAWKPNWEAFLGAIWGWPIVLLAAIYLLAFACLAAGTGKFDSRTARNWALAAGLAIIAIGCWWASNAVLWNGAISYRRFVLACALPLVAMAGVHARAIRRDTTPHHVPFFNRTCIFATWAFVIVYAVQAWTWRSDIARFSAALRTSPAPFVTTEDLPWIRNSPLEHWSATMLSILVQGRQPRTIFSEHREGNAEGHIILFPGEGGLFPGHDGWFFIDPSHRAAAPLHSRE